MFRNPKKDIFTNLLWALNPCIHSYRKVYGSLPMTHLQGNISSGFSNSSAAFVSELLGNLKEIFPCYSMYIYI